MKNKYEIRLKMSSTNGVVYTLATSSGLLPTRGFFNRKIRVDEGSYYWRTNDDKNGQDLVVERDTAKYLLTLLLQAKHKERTAWLTGWDLLKMFACIPRTSTNVFVENGRRFVKLEHADYSRVELHDVERDFMVFSEDLDYFTSQGLRLQD